MEPAGDRVRGQATRQGTIVSAGVGVVDSVGDADSVGVGSRPSEGDGLTVGSSDGCRRVTWVDGCGRAFLGLLLVIDRRSRVH